MAPNASPPHVADFAHTHTVVAAPPVRLTSTPSCPPNAAPNRPQPVPTCGLARVAIFFYFLKHLSPKFWWQILTTDVYHHFWCPLPFCHFNLVTNLPPKFVTEIFSDKLLLLWHRIKLTTKVSITQTFNDKHSFVTKTWSFVAEYFGDKKPVFYLCYSENFYYFWSGRVLTLPQHSSSWHSNLVRWLFPASDE